MEGISSSFFFFFFFFSNLPKSFGKLMELIRP